MRNLRCLIREHMKYFSSPLKYSLIVLLYFMGVYMLFGTYRSVTENSFLAIPIGEMKIVFKANPEKSIAQEGDAIFSVVVNGSYF